MTEPKTSFRDFEHQGWSDQEVAANYHDFFSPLTTQAIGALLDATAVRPGMWVADVATGAGYVAAAAAERGAEVVGIDFSSTQLALARQLYPDLELRQGDAGALPLPDDSFDAVISNFGMPHFPDPDAFLREAYRVLRGTGRVAFSAWASAQECVGFGLVYSAVQAYGRMDVPLPPGPNFFLFGDPAQCERSFQAAGFRSVAVTKVAQVWRVMSPDAPLDMILNGTVRAAALLRAQTPTALAAIREAVHQAVTAYARDGAFELPMPATLATAEKP
jgi:SAM-dependent methyltransferase